MADVAVIGFAQSPNVRHGDGHHQRRGDAGADLPRGAREHRAGQGRHRLLVLGLVGLPGRPGVLVRLGGRRDRRVPAGHGVARGDGRGLGAVRGLGEDPDRRGRHRAGLRLRQVVGGRTAPGARPATRPVPARAAVAGLGGIAALQARLGIEAGLWTEKDMAEVAARSRAAALGEPGGPAVRRRSRAEELLGRAVPRRPAAGARLRAGQRRRRRGDPGVRRAGPRAVRAAGLDHRVRAPDRLRGAGRPRPDHGRRRRPAAGRAAGRRRRRGGRTARAVHPSGDPAARRRWGWATASGSTRPAARWPATRCSRPGWPGSGGGAARSCRRPRGPRARPRDQRSGAAAEPRLRHGGRRSP